MSPSAPAPDHPSPRPASRPRLLVALAVVGVLAAAHLGTSVQRLASEKWWDGMRQPRRLDGTYNGLRRAVNMPWMQTHNLGLTVRGAQGPAALVDVVAPTKLEQLNVRPIIYRQGSRKKNYYITTLPLFMAGKFRQVEYDPHLTDAELEAVKAGATIDRTPGDIYIVRNERMDGRWILHVDALNQYVYLVPAASSPLGELAVPAKRAENGGER